MFNALMPLWLRGGGGGGVNWLYSIFIRACIKHNTYSQLPGPCAAAAFPGRLNGDAYMYSLLRTLDLWLGLLIASCHPPPSGEVIPEKHVACGPGQV